MDAHRNIALIESSFFDFQISHPALLLIQRAYERLLCRRLSKIARNTIIYVDTPIMRERLAQKNISAQLFQDFLAEKEFSQYFKRATLLIDKISTELGFDTEHVYKGVNCWLVLAQHFKLYFLIPFLKQFDIMKKVVHDPPSTVYTTTRCRGLGSIASLSSQPARYLEPSLFSSLRSGLHSAVKERIALRRQLSRFSLSSSEKIPSSGTTLFYHLQIKQEATQFLPIIKHALSQEHLRTLVLCTGTGAQEILLKEHIPFVTLNKYFSLQQEQDISSFHQKLIDDFQEIKKHPLMIDGLNVMPALAPLIEQRIRRDYSLILRMICSLDRLYQEEQVTGLILGNNHNPLERAAVLLGRAKKIPSIQVQHGVVAQACVYADLLSEKMAVFGEESKRILEKEGLTSSRLVVTGKPEYDSWATSPLSKPEACEKLGLDPLKRVIAIGTQPLLGDNISSPHTFSFFLFAINRIIQENADAEILIKLHPRDQLSYYREIIHSSNVHIHQSVPIKDVLFACDIFITLNSTTALEALMMKKPVIIINKDGMEKNSYVDARAALEIRSLDDTKKIAGWLENKKVRDSLEEHAQKFIERNLYKMDGNSSGRIIQLMERMLHHRAKKPFLL